MSDAIPNELNPGPPAAPPQLDNSTGFNAGTEMPAGPPPGEGGAPDRTEPLQSVLGDAGDVDIEGLIRGNPVGDQSRQNSTESQDPALGGNVTADSEDVSAPSGDPEQQGSSTLGQFTKFKLPDGYRGLEGEEASRFLQFASEHGLTQEQAQAQIDFDAQRIERARAKAESRMKVHAQALQQKRIEQMRSDADIGGTAAKLKESIGNFNSAVNTLGGDELRNFLFRTGLAYEPVIVKAFARAYQGLGEAGQSLEGARPALSERTLAQRLLGVGVD
jgi:hypothetical protein